jgi:aromatic ring-opening dioxygenase catalytic subunit (LigB family)
MTLINPSANIPIVQLSVLSSDSPAQHFAMGQALASLRDSGVAIIGSGMPTFHNLRIMNPYGVYNKAFEKTLTQFSETVTNTIKVENSEERKGKLEGWRDWVGAVESHPHRGVEHFLPLIVCAGAGGDGKAGSFADEFMGIDQYTYFWN